MNLFCLATFLLFHVVSGRVSHLYRDVLNVERPDLGLSNGELRVFDNKSIQQRYLEYFPSKTSNSVVFLCLSRYGSFSFEAACPTMMKAGKEQEAVQVLLEHPYYRDILNHSYTFEFLQSFTLEQVIADLIDFVHHYNQIHPDSVNANTRWVLFDEDFDNSLLFRMAIEKYPEIFEYFNSSQSLTARVSTGDSFVVNTFISPFSWALTTSTSNNIMEDNSLLVQLLAADGVKYWEVLLSPSLTRADLTADIGPEDKSVIFTTGLSLRYMPQGTAGTLVMLSGTIIDNNTVYTITSLVLGNFFVPVITHDVGCINPVSTYLTGSSSSTTFLPVDYTDVNHHVSVNLMTEGVSFWTGVLSTANAKVVLPSTVGSDNVQFMKGLTLTLLPQGTSGYYVFLTGEIVDKGTSFSFVNKYVGAFYCAASMPVSSQYSLDNVLRTAELGGSQQCADVLKDAQFAVDAMLQTPSTRRQLENKFVMCGSDAYYGDGEVGGGLSPLDDENNKLLFRANLVDFNIPLGLVPANLQLSRNQQDFREISTACQVLLNESFNSPIDKLAALNVRQQKQFRSRQPCWLNSFNDIVYAYSMTKNPARLWLYNRCIQGSVDNSYYSQTFDLDREISSKYYQLLCSKVFPSIPESK